MLHRIPFLARAWRAACVSIALVFASPPVSAWTETFENGGDNVWRGAALDFSGSALNMANLHFEVATVNGNGIGKVIYGNTALPASSPEYSRGVVAVGWIDETFGDTRVSALVNPGNQPHSQMLGLVARGSPDFSAYVLGLDMTASGRLTLMRQDPGFASQFVSLGHSFLTGMDPTSAYWLELDVIGSQLTGRVYDSDRAALLASVDALDATLTEGVAGVFAMNLGPAPSSPQSIAAYGAFDNISAIPEPSTYGLILAGLGLVGLKARTRKCHTIRPA